MPSHMRGNACSVCVCVCVCVLCWDCCGCLWLFRVLHTNLRYFHKIRDCSNKHCTNSRFSEFSSYLSYAVVPRSFRGRSRRSAAGWFRCCRLPVVVPMPCCWFGHPIVVPSRRSAVVPRSFPSFRGRPAGVSSFSRRFVVLSFPCRLNWMLVNHFAFLVNHVGNCFHSSSHQAYF
jgi:hypothetical protein